MTLKLPLQLQSKLQQLAVGLVDPPTTRVRHRLEAQVLHKLALLRPTPSGTPWHSGTGEPGQPQGATPYIGRLVVQDNQQQFFDFDQAVEN